MKLSLELNGKATELEVEPDMPLLWVLRDILNLTGTKFGCGAGLCGACTVHLNDDAVRACQLPASAVQGQRVTTIEGLATASLHPVQEAWLELQVPQCGYCQTGQIMSASALLKKTPSPTPSQVDGAMRGNLCRCGSYARIREAVQRAARGGRE